MSAPLVLAVDGGNSKTDLALLREDGTLLAHVRGGLSSPHHLGLDGSRGAAPGPATTRRWPQAGSASTAAGRPRSAQLLLAGLDFPAEERELHDAVAARGWARSIAVGNDTFAVLRAGTERGWGVAVVCGAGINCVGVGPDGRHVRFPALGAISGDWGGGFDVGLAALSAAARSEDGRGPRTGLERAVPALLRAGARRPRSPRRSTSARSRCAASSSCRRSCSTRPRGDRGRGGDRRPPRGRDRRAGAGRAAPARADRRAGRRPARRRAVPAGRRAR